MFKYINKCEYPILLGKSIYCTYDYMDPDYGGNHYGIDIIAKKGNVLDYVTAMDTGEVIYVKNSVNSVVRDIKSPDALGNNVKIRHADGTVSHYCHLKSGSVTVKVGETVEKGQVIGYIGDTGYTFGAHLHFQIFENGVRCDPKPFLSGKAQGWKRYRTNCRLNVRNDPSLSSKVLGSLGANCPIAVVPHTEIISDGICWIRFSPCGWLAKKYLTRI